jgi:hypothetical protein
MFAKTLLLHLCLPSRIYELHCDILFHLIVFFFGNFSVELFLHLLSGQLFEDFALKWTKCPWAINGSFRLLNIYFVILGKIGVRVLILWILNVIKIRLRKSIVMGLRRMLRHLIIRLIFLRFLDRHSFMWRYWIFQVLNLFTWCPSASASTFINFVEIFKLFVNSLGQIMDLLYNFLILALLILRHLW